MQGWRASRRQPSVLNREGLATELLPAPLSAKLVDVVFPTKEAVMSKVDWAERVRDEQAEVDHLRAELRSFTSLRNNPRGRDINVRLRQAEARLATAKERANRQAL